MARDWKTTYSASVSSADHTVNFPQPALAGRKLVAFGAAPANIALPAGWTQHAYDLSATSGSIAGSKAAVGGESSLTFTRQSGQNTLPRTLAGWVESRDDLGTIHGSPVVISSANVSAGTIALPSITTTADGCRVYVTITQALPGSAWTPTWPSQLTGEDVFTAPGLGNEALRFAVASGVLESAGSHSLTVSGLPNGTYQVFAVTFETQEGGTPPPAAETAVEAENRLPGTAKSVWDISGAGDTSIQGFATSMSVNRGSTLSVKVHSPQSAWTGTVYRLGYYSGAGARQVTTITGPQTTQPNGTTDPTTGMVSCANWTANGSWAVPADAPAGVYIIKIHRNDSPSAASHIGPFVVADPNRKAKIVVKLSDATWQAYNHFGANPADPLNGKSLYGPGNSSGFTFHAPSRCKAVSYDRPFVTRQFLPQTWFFNAEYPMMRWFERLGYDVDYVSCAQVDADPTLLQGREVVISSGHDEYWSVGMWDAFVAARDHSTQNSNLAFFSGNEAFWHIRFAGDRRSYSCWKDTHDGQLNSTGQYSGTWQDTRPFNQLRRPPALLTGTRFRLNGMSAFPLIATADHASSPLWRDTAVAQLTGSQTWQSPNHIVGFEADEPADTSTTEKPTGIIRLSEGSRTVNGMLSDENGDNYAQSGTFTHALTAYRVNSGSLVFGAGTVQYSWALDDIHDRYPGFSGVTPVLQQALTNLLADLGALPPAYPFPAELSMPTPVSLSEYGFPSLPPVAPTGLSAAPAQTSVSLEWTASSGATGYRIYRNGSLSVEVASSPTTYVASGLTAGTVYQWYVTAINDIGEESSPSNTVSVTTLPATPPSSPFGPNETLNAAKMLAREFKDFKNAVESGTVTGGVSPTLFNAKGDLLAASASDTPTVVPVGNNGQILSADSTAPAGLKWSDPPEGGGGTSGEPVIQPGTVSQYYRGDKTWQPLNKVAVGLPLVDNTSDSQKPVSVHQDNADKQRPVLKLWNQSTQQYDTVVGGTIYVGGSSDPTVNPGDIWIESA